MHICGFLVNNEGASLKRIENGAFNLFSHLIYALLLQILTDGKNVLSKCVSSDPHSDWLKRPIKRLQILFKLIGKMLGSFFLHQYRFPTTVICICKV